MHIREASEEDRDDVVFVERATFGCEEIDKLVSDLLDDPSAQPMLSLLAFEGDRAVGHILFSRARVTNAQNTAAILAPLAVVSDKQKQGIGGKLIESGLQRLSESGVDLVFVLGYPDYYLRHGFKPAGEVGLEAPYPIPEKNADAWMVQPLKPNLIGKVTGKVICAKALDKPEYWRE